MCQANVIIEKVGEAEPVMEGVASLEVCEKGILLKALMEEPKLVSGVVIKSIDFHSGRVVLTEANPAQ